MRLEFTWVDVFTERPLAGNPLAVFPDAGAATTDQLQAVARELNLSECAFAVGRDGPRHRVRIFTPEVELPFAGHPSLGAAAVLHGRGAPEGEVRLSLAAGEVPVRVAPAAHGARAELVAPAAVELPTLVTPTGAAAALGLEPAELAGAPAVWSCGNPFLFVPLRSREAVARTRCPAGRPGDVLGWVPFARTGELAVHARVFCPGSAVPEDPATGSANAPLVALLHARGQLDAGATLVTTQGVEMGRPSRLEARLLVRPDGPRPYVAGGVVWLGSGFLELP